MPRIRDTSSHNPHIRGLTEGLRALSCAGCTVVNEPFDLSQAA
jgi:hypothetical protein